MIGAFVAGVLDGADGGFEVAQFLIDILDSSMLGLMTATKSTVSTASHETKSTADGSSIASSLARGDVGADAVALPQRAEQCPETRATGGADAAAHESVLQRLFGGHSFDALGIERRRTSTHEAGECRSGERNGASGSGADITSSTTFTPGGEFLDRDTRLRSEVMQRVRGAQLTSPFEVGMRHPLSSEGVNWLIYPVVLAKRVSPLLGGGTRSLKCAAL